MIKNQTSFLAGMWLCEVSHRIRSEQNTQNGCLRAPEALWASKYSRFSARVIDGVNKQAYFPPLQSKDHLYLNSCTKGGVTFVYRSFCK